MPMPYSLMQLRLAEGWREVAPRVTGRELVWVAGDQLLASATDFGDVRRLGHAGAADCPVAVDPARGLAYRYCCPSAPGQRDYSEIRAFDLSPRGGPVRRALALDPNQWVVWLLRKLEGHEAVVALVATDVPGAGVKIRHQLAFFDPDQGRAKFVPLCRDSFHPMDFSERRRQLLFKGGEGIYTVGLDGRRLLTLRGGHSDQLPAGRGGRFHPEDPCAVIGGRGLFLWHQDGGRLERIEDDGQFPVWDPRATGGGRPPPGASGSVPTKGNGNGNGRGEGGGGGALWFSRTSGDLFHFGLGARSARRIVAVMNNRYGEIAYASPAVPSRDGSLVATVLTYKYLPSELELAPAGEAGTPDRAPSHPNPGRERSPNEFHFEHAIVVLDPARKELWRHRSPFTRNLAWYEPGG